MYIERLSNYQLYISYEENGRILRYANENVYFILEKRINLQISTLTIAVFLITKHFSNSRERCVQIGHF